MLLQLYAAVNAAAAVGCSLGENLGVVCVLHVCVVGCVAIASVYVFDV
jgi:hypothetical protein